MRFMLMDRVHPGTDEMAMPSEQQMTDMTAFMEENQDILHAAEGFFPTSDGVRITLSKDGTTTVARGPFTDTISNFAIIEADSEEAAIEHVKAWQKIWGECETEIRRVVEESDLPPQ
jgi:hypothetical protein